MLNIKIVPLYLICYIVTSWMFGVNFTTSLDKGIEVIGLMCLSLGCVDIISYFFIDTDNEVKTIKHNN